MGGPTSQRAADRPCSVAGPRSRSRSRRWLLRTAGLTAAGVSAIRRRVAHVSSGIQAPHPARPIPAHTPDAADTIRPDHRSQRRQDDDVRVASDTWKAYNPVEAGTGPAGHPLYRIAAAKPGTENVETTVSEGQGYGMVVDAYHAGPAPDARAVFDRLWRYARANPSVVEPRLMNRRIPPPVEGGNDSAFDGDCDIAYALLLAAQRWGEAGAIDYATAGREAIAGIMEATIGPRGRIPRLRDWNEPERSPATGTPLAPPTSCHARPRPRLRRGGPGDPPPIARCARGELLRGQRGAAVTDGHDGELVGVGERLSYRGPKRSRRSWGPVERITRRCPARERSGNRAPRESGTDDLQGAARRAVHGIGPASPGRRCTWLTPVVLRADPGRSVDHGNGTGAE